jgi:hypothetical protein
MGLKARESKKHHDSAASAALSASLMGSSAGENGGGGFRFETGRLAGLCSPNFGQRRFIRYQQQQQKPTTTFTASGHQLVSGQLARRATERNVREGNESNMPEQQKTSNNNTQQQQSRMEQLFNSKKSPVVIRRLSRKVNWITQQLSR